MRFQFTQLSFPAKLSAQFCGFQKLIFTNLPHGLNWKSLAKAGKYLLLTEANLMKIAAMGFKLDFFFFYVVLNSLIGNDSLAGRC